MRRTTAIAAFTAIALAAVGCSSSSSSSGSATSSGSAAASGNTVDIYSSLPLQGGSSAQTIPMVNGIKLALSQANNKAGQWTVNYQSLDDSTAAKAIAARAAMAVVRLMIFLSFFEVVRLPQSALTGLVCACGLVALRQPSVADLTKSLTAAGPCKGRFRPGSRAGRMSL